MKPSFVLTLTLAMLVFDAKSNARPDGRKLSLLTDEHLGTRHARKTRHSSQIYPGYGYQGHQYFDHLQEQINELTYRVQKLSAAQYSYPAYIPYPVYIPIPYPGVFNGGNTTQPILNNRLPEIWDIIKSSTEAPSDDDDDDYTRPINLNPSKLETPSGVRVPPVEHGSIQGDVIPTTQKPRVTTEKPKTKTHAPTLCEAAVLKCCRFEEPERMKCFEEYSCLRTYRTGKACLPEVIDMVIKIFTDAYKPR